MRTLGIKFEFEYIQRIYPGGASMWGIEGFEVNTWLTNQFL